MDKHGHTVHNVDVCIVWKLGGMRARSCRIRFLLRVSESENLKQEKYVILNHQCDWHLSQLGKRIEKPPTGLSTASIYYECNRKDDRKDKNDTTKSFGFNILYTLKSKKKCFLSSEVPTVLEIFAGCGGMSQGFKKAGFDVKWAVEKDHHAVSTFMINHPEVDMFNECVRTWFEKVKRKPEMYSHIKPDHIHFSSPCQGFSRANRNGGRNDEANNNLSLFCIEIVAHFLPKTISFENVTGMAHGSNIKYLQDIVASFVDMDAAAFKDTEEQVFYEDPTRSEGLLIFKINEAYHKRRAKTPLRDSFIRVSQNFYTHIFVIKKFKVKDGKKYAVGIVYQFGQDYKYDS